MTQALTNSAWTFRIQGARFISSVG